MSGRRGGGTASSGYHKEGSALSMFPSLCTGCGKRAHTGRHPPTCQSCSTKPGDSKPSALAIDLTGGGSPPPSSPESTPRRPLKKRAGQAVVMEVDSDSDDDVVLVSSRKTWACAACSLVNPMEAESCEVCETAAPHAKSAIPPNTWVCPICTLHNPDDSDECAVCGALNPSAPATSSSSSSTQPPPTPSSCPQCMLPNVVSRTGVCQACGHVVPPPAPYPPMAQQAPTPFGPSAPQPPTAAPASTTTNTTQAPVAPVCKSCAFFARRGRACQTCGNPRPPGGPWTCTICGYPHNAASQAACGKCANFQNGPGYNCPQCKAQCFPRASHCPNCSYALGTMHARKPRGSGGRGAPAALPPFPPPPSLSSVAQLANLAMNQITGIFGLPPPGIPPSGLPPRGRSAPGRSARGRPAQPPTPLACVEALIQRGGQQQHFTLQAVPAGSQEYTSTCAHMGGYQTNVCAITKVVRCFQSPRNEGVRRDYFNRGIVVSPRLVWHGTDIDAIENILTKGFAVIPNPRNGRSYGHGIYLSPLTNTAQSMGYSHPDTHGTKHMLLCQLYARKTEAIRSSDQWQQHDPDAEAAENSSMLVVFQSHANTALLPVYIISFK